MNVPSFTLALACKSSLGGDALSEPRADDDRERFPAHSHSRFPCPFVSFFFVTSKTSTATTPQLGAHAPLGMPPKPERSSDTPARGRFATATDQPDAREATSNSTFTRAPSYSPAELAGFRDFANVMRDAIGEKGMKGSVKERQPAEAARRGCLGTLKSLHRRGRVTFDKWLSLAAASGGQLKVLKWLLENRCPVDEATDEGATPLYLAAQNGHGAVVRAPIQAGADVDKASNDGLTLLYIVAYDDRETVVRALIEAGADVNKAPDSGVTLYIAAYDGRETVVRALIKAGADVNKAKDNGVTPLFIAAQTGHKTVVRVLIELGADINKAMDDGATPLTSPLKTATRRWCGR